MDLQLTELGNDFVFVELHDGAVSHEYNLDYDLFEKAGSGVGLFQNKKTKKFQYKGLYWPDFLYVKKYSFNQPVLCRSF